jgi:hypothetical protein
MARSHNSDAKIGARSSVVPDRDVVATDADLTGV